MTREEIKKDLVDFMSELLEESMGANLCNKEGYYLENALEDKSVTKEDLLEAFKASLTNLNK